MTTQAPHPLPVSVVIPTYQRPDALVDCVRSLLEGTVLPNEIIIVGREDDESTRQALRQLSAGPKDSVSVRSVWVRRPGHMPPVEAGLQPPLPPGCAPLPVFSIGPPGR